LANPEGAQLHIGFGEQLLHGRPSPSAAVAPDAPETFTGRWYAVAASGFVAQTDALRARPIVERGLTRAPASAALRLIAGIVEEMEAGQVDPDVVRGSEGPTVTMRRNARTGMEGLARLALAEREYRRALDLDPSMPHAWLRLGRVLHLLGRPLPAREALDRARDLARRPADQHLVRLFLGQIDEAAGDLDAARRWFDEARAHTPGVQSAWLALAQLEERAGQIDRARTLTREGLTGARLSSDPWWEYRNGGLDGEGLAWLRAQVQR
jgi:tetratricopeptide (TPR) repeat protein